jgi:CheY-like chemotaxis protein
MNEEDKKEHRRKKRLPIKGNILVDGKVMFKCIDISEGGLYLYTGQSFEKGKIVTVTLPIKGSPLTVKAKVQHNQPGIGMGLQFIDLTDEQLTVIKKLIKNMMERSTRRKDERKKILLVEDNEMSRQIYKNKLLLEGFSIIEARDGIEAIKLLNDISPDLIVLDLYTGKMDGFKVLSILKINPKWENIPVVVFSESGTPDVIDAIIKAGADEFLSKMLTSPSKLAETVKAILTRKINRL